MNTLLRLPFSLTAVCSLLAVLNPVAVFAGWDALNDFIETPSDSGSSPVIWYQTQRSPNFGSGAETLTLTSGTGVMTAQGPDFFGNPTGAFALASGSGGAAIAGSTSTTYLTGSQATLITTFQTPSAITANASILSRGDGSTGAGNPKFEVFLLGASKSLRITTGDTQFGVNTVLAPLTEGTWYYLALTWDLSLPNNQMPWYLGEMGSATLSSGLIDNVSVVGNPGLPIRVAGRPSFDSFPGSYQNIAIYDRALSGQAIQDQFSAIPEPSTYAAILGFLALAGGMWRRRKNL